MAVYTETVAEDASSGTSVLRVLATSRDIGVNAEISYAIISGNEQRQFGIHPESGQLRGMLTLLPLDKMAAVS